jgi:[CysO sulfur-carrier protein]-S-L-cysteine hydrolase
VIVARRVLDEVFTHAGEEKPNECCGMLLGASGRIEKTYRARNLAGDPNRFVIDPQDHIAARRLARGERLEIVGFYHSHPHSSAFPSARDLAEWTYPESVALIVSLEGQRPAARLFKLSGDVIELPVEAESVVD